MGILSAVLCLTAIPVVGDMVEHVPDSVELKDGETVEGLVAYENDEKVVVRIGTKETTYPVGEVASVRSRARELEELLSRLDRSDAKDAREQFELASFAASRGLDGEAELLYTRTVLLDPGLEAAHEALGHQKKGDEWRWPYKKKQWDRDRLWKKRLSWSDAWEFTTTHYVIRSNMELGRVVDAALDLERFHSSFRRAFPELEIHEPWEVQEASLHGDPVSFPDIGDDRPAYFSFEQNRLIVNMSTGQSWWSMIHEATHQVLYSSMELTPKARGEVPAWLSEGLAEYMASSAVGEIGSSSFNAGRPAEHHFRVHADEKKPYKLGRTLHFGVGDFTGSSKADLKYAQCYTLVDFALHGEKGAYREGFLRFLAGAFEGRAKKKDFLRELDVKEKEFEQAWHAYAGEMLGQIHGVDASPK